MNFIKCSYGLQKYIFMFFYVLNEKYLFENERMKFNEDVLDDFTNLQKQYLYVVIKYLN